MYNRKPKTNGVPHFYKPEVYLSLIHGTKHHLHKSEHPYTIAANKIFFSNVIYYGIWKAFQ